MPEPFDINTDDIQTWLRESAAELGMEDSHDLVTLMLVGLANTIVTAHLQMFSMTVGVVMGEDE